MSTVALFLVRIWPTKANTEPLAFLPCQKNRWFRKMGSVMYRKGHLFASTSHFHTFSTEQHWAIDVRVRPGTSKGTNNKYGVFSKNGHFFWTKTMGRIWSNKQIRCDFRCFFFKILQILQWPMKTLIATRDYRYRFYIYMHLYICIYM